MGPVLSSSLAVHRWLLIFLQFFLPLSSTPDMPAKGGFMEDGMWDESSRMVKWIHRGECAKCLMREDFLKQNRQGRKVHSLLPEFKEVALPPPPPQWPLSFQPHLPFTLDLTWTWLYIRQIALGDKGNISSYWCKVKASPWDHQSASHPPLARSCLPHLYVHMPALRSLSQQEPQNFRGHLERASRFRKMPFWALGPASSEITVDNLKNVFLLW